MPKLVIFAGAPEAPSLNWSLPLHDAFTHPLASLLGSPTGTSSTASRPPPPRSTSPPSEGPAWRSVPLRKAALHTGLTQRTPCSDTPSLPSFLQPQFASSRGSSSSSSSSFPRPFEDAWSEDGGEGEEEDLSGSFDDGYSLAPADDASYVSSGYSVAPSLEVPGAAPHPPTDLSNLRPRSSSSLAVTLLVGVISLAGRTVRTRFGEREMVEALVGDDTRSAFQLTFWLGAPGAGAGSALGREVAGLRAGDVVLVRGVRVGVFRGSVFGQSGGGGGGGTRVSLLFREGPGGGRGHYGWGDMVAGGGVHPQLGKTRRVRRWMRGVDMRAGDGRLGEVDNMPDDTLE